MFPCDVRRLQTKIEVRARVYGGDVRVCEGGGGGGGYAGACWRVGEYVCVRAISKNVDYCVAVGNGVWMA